LDTLKSIEFCIKYVGHTMNTNNQKSGFKVLVPAHLDSERLPGKVLMDIAGKPMLLRVLEQCEKAVGRDNLCVVTPDQEIFQLARRWGFPPFKSSTDLPDGTSAIASIVPQLDVDFIVNIQGDQPLIPPSLIRDLITNLLQKNADIVTPVFRIEEIEDLGEKGVAKVVRDLEGWALYFSRNPIPFIRDASYENWLNEVPFWDHYGIYGYSRETLINLERLKASYLEDGEKLEQLRFLQNGLRIFTFETNYRQLAVDTAEDLEKILRLIKQNPNLI
jgi:3-deoxy-manno-octulosonate cytidylyltransferase (CMP-KDO synthetase)